MFLGVSLVIFGMMYVMKDTTTTTDTNMLEERLNTEETVDDMVNQAVSDDLKDVLGE